VVKGLPGWGLYWNNTVALALGNKDIITLDVVTGSQIAVLSGHTGEVNSVTFC
jgi:hypothetical protein